MRRVRDSLISVIVLVGFVAIAALIVFALGNATERGVNALEESLQAEVSAIAASQDQRVANTLSGVAGLSARPFELVPGSETDQAFLDSIAELVQDLRSGFYLLDVDDRVTQGIHLLNPEQAVGAEFEWPGFDALRQSDAYNSGIGGILPVSEGITTAEPVTALAFPIVDQQTGEVRGSIVAEQVVAPDSDFNEEIRQLSRGETGQYLFLDSMGTVIAANDPSLIATPTEDARYLERDPGLYRFDDLVVALADVPSAGWRIVFRQSEAEFEEDLSKPLQQVTLVMVLVLVAVGAIFTFFLTRRLRAAREEQLRLQRINEAQEEFISIVSHELRTPVAGILGFLQTSLDHWEVMNDEERIDAVRRAATNARRLQALTRDVLDTQSVESGQLAYNFEPGDLTEEVRTAIDAARDLTPERSYELSLPSGSVPVEIDSDRIQQVLTNLLDNAQKNSPAASPVEISVTVADSAATVAVRDHGAGFEPEAIDRMFEKFVRGRHDAVSGTGLGLYISRQIVEAHGGTIIATSRPGEGAEFLFTLPLLARPGASPRPEAERATAPATD